MATINCPKCGARVEFEAGTKCSHCGTETCINRSGASFYHIIPFSVNENDAVGIFKRLATGSTKAKDLDKLAQIDVVGDSSQCTCSSGTLAGKKRFMSSRPDLRLYQVCVTSRYLRGTSGYSMISSTSRGPNL
jgi:hypothetical protein